MSLLLQNMKYKSGVTLEEAIESQDLVLSTSRNSVLAGPQGSD